MTENEFILADRIAKIKSVIEKYGEENFYLSFSGGKDSTVLHHLIDEALPGNRIPRVYSNTGIEYKTIVDFVKELQTEDDRIVIIQPSVPIKKMLEEVGYPFKSKLHSTKVNLYQKYGKEGSKAVRVYLGEQPADSGAIIRGDHRCPKMLVYQFTEKFKIPVSQGCCNRLKKEPLHKWQKENGYKYGIVGIMATEGGQREKAQCLAFKGDKLKNFQPLAPLNKEWEDWYIKERNIRLCKLYYPPYNFTRTGCKGCPYNLTLQRELDTLDKYFPAERKQCEYIWKPIYEEYRRIGYRKMRPLDEGRQTTIEEFLVNMDEEKP
jgi:3'-phosphoadenosine 5'-phosphosulfate sulfotransferase (PAPS reductase)/FAD synthetase